MGAWPVEGKVSYPRSFAIPWHALASESPLARGTQGRHALAVSGFGHFLSVQRGDMLACLIPPEPILDRGADTFTAVSFLAQVPWMDFESFIDTYCLFANLLPGRALWVPYGWRADLTPLPADTHSHVLYVPYTGTRMLLATTLKKEFIA